MNRAQSLASLGQLNRAPIELSVWLTDSLLASLENRGGSFKYTRAELAGVRTPFSGKKKDRKVIGYFFAGCKCSSDDLPLPERSSSVTTALLNRMLVAQFSFRTWGTS